MQRKRTRGYYSETVELGTHLLPVAQMRKFKMKISNVIKYVIFFIIAYIICSVYQKASKPEVDTDYWSHEIIDRNKQAKEYVNLEEEFDTKLVREKDREINHKKLEHDNDRRVKQEINKVFEDFKRQQEQKYNDKKENKDVFKDYYDQRGKENIDAEKQIFRDKADVNVNTIQNRDHGLELDGTKGDEENENDIEMFEVEEDLEKDKEELEVEKEIEERLAEVFEEAIHKAAEKVNDKKPDEVNKMIKVEKPGDIVNGVDNVKVPVLQQAFPKKEEFMLAVNNVGKKLNPRQIHMMNEKARRDALKNDDDHEFPPFVTAVREKTVKDVTQLVASVQEYFPGRKIYIYDLDLDKDTKKQLMSYCGVKMRLFMKEIFPSYVKNLDNLHWKPLVMQTALAEFGHMIWVNPQYHLTSQELAPLIHESHDKGILAVGQNAAYTTYAATHPDMLKFIPSNVEKLSREPHFEIRAVLIHNTDVVHQNVMKIFTACAMEDSCLAPEGSKWNCRFDFTGRKPAGCHRYDESALNILLKNWFDFDTRLYARENSYFKSYDSSYRPKLKSCRDPRDIKEKEL